MGAWKPQRFGSRRAFHAAISNRAKADTQDLFAKAGKRALITANPVNRVPSSAIIVEMMTPCLPGLPRPASKSQLSALASVCAAAWNASRLERGNDQDRAKAEEEAAFVLDVNPNLALVFDELRQVARELYPEDGRLIVNTVVDLRGGELRVTAASLGGID